MVLTHEDVVSVWGENDVVMLSAEDFEALKLPECARHILVEIGLPAEAEMLFVYEKPEWIKIGDKLGRYCKIGSDHGNKLCIDPDSGQLFSLSSSGGAMNRFVNSKSEFFIEFLCRVIPERRKGSRRADGDFNITIKKLKSQLRRRDREAFAAPDHWWSVIFEQMEGGVP